MVLAVNMLGDGLRIYSTKGAEANLVVIRLTVACRCEVVFERWITPWDAELDLLRAASLN